MSQGYWAVLPSDVRYDRRLSQTAKLLYAEISALAQTDGYCWAADAHLAETLGVSVATITRALRALRGCGYIRSDLSANASGTERHIYCGFFAAKGGIVKNDETPDGTLDGTITSDDTPIVKNDDTPRPTQYNGNNKKKNIRAEINSIFDGLCGEDGELRDLIDDFCVIRAELKKPITTTRMANILANRLRRGSGGRHDVMARMLENAIDGRWQTVYPLKPEDMPADTPAGRPTAERPDVSEWRPDDD